MRPNIYVGPSGDNASQWMEKYFDAFLHLANWGSRQLMLPLPVNQSLSRIFRFPYS